ncbi:MAG TPA: GNAT family protein [Acidimicrobiales bacterium]|nr:GNAT family protein [Acidimicrobiales bacterium]
MIRALPLELHGRRVLLRPLATTDFAEWQAVRRRNRDWLTKWEPIASPGAPDVVEDPKAFAARCGARERERQLGTGYAFGIFVVDRFAGEMNLSNVSRGAMQSCTVGYWIDEELAGRGYVPEALVAALRFAFEDLGLHRVEVGIIPRNQASRRVVEKLGIRDEGLAERFLQINGVWEDHIRYGITVEEWEERGDALVKEWL